MATEFRNEPLTDFSKPENKKRMESAIERVHAQLGQRYPLVIGNEKRLSTDFFPSRNPADPDEIVGHFSKGEKADAVKSIEVAAKSFESWKRVKPEERASHLFKAAARMRDRKYELSAWMIFEVGKSWVEADADVAEAIDFLEFYGREMIRLGGAQPLTPAPGEKNELHYIPLGVCVVLPPWNFPLAITTGMTSAAIVAGNTVVLKPSSDSPAIAAKMCEVFEEAGLPPGVLNFVTGSGGAIGDTLVEHPKTRMIAFTGSKAVGLHINELAAKVSPGQIWVKRVIAEMGGKDAIVVDADTDLDEAAMGVANSAFGYQGQKCSACSRVIVDKKVYDEFLGKLVKRVQAITVGPTRDQSNFMGPVVSERAMKSILEYIDIGKKEGRVVAGGGKTGAKGYFIQPTVIADVAPNARLSQEEIFGPVLAVTKAENFDEALEIANNTEYGLTGAVYTRDRAKLEAAKQAFHVGNLYLNRKCTGAMVGAHPFGGFNMSGTDSKAGGRDYLLLFTQAKVWSEKV
ncbi:MAG: L-glutamate gamma-semialdehyde dehydrogenase [Planctomycetes bacterium]|nr:L-glutamate gamma-semialdehyde dehydrogenase [Planctomycetota bacterium]